MYSFQGTQNADYLDGMNEIVHLCFVYRKNPEVISEHILTKLMKFIFEEDEGPESGKKTIEIVYGLCILFVESDYFVISSPYRNRLH